MTGVRAGVVAAAAADARVVVPAVADPIDRTSHALVLATMTAAALTAAQIAATCVFLTSKSPSAGGASARALILTRSKAIVTSSSPPVITPASSDGHAAS